MHVTERARSELREGEALVFDWHRIAICCATAGEVSLRRARIGAIESSPAFVRMSGREEAPVFAHRHAYVHLVERPVTIDCRRRLGRRRFSSDLPSDFGLRAVFGRLPEATQGGGPK